MSRTEIISKADGNHRRINENTDRLAKKYNNTWIAVVDRSVIDSDASLETMARLKQKLAGRYSEVAIEYVTDKPLNMVL